MTRLVVFAVDLAAVARRDLEEGTVRWAELSDREAAVSAGLRDYAVGSGDGGEVRAAVLRLGSRVIARSLFWTGRTPYSDWALFKLRETDVMSTDSFVLPEFRGQRALAKIKTYAAKEHLKQGRKRLLAFVKTRNISSLKAHAHLGGTPLFVVRKYRVLGFTMIWLRGRLFLGKYGPRRRYIIDCA